MTDARLVNNTIEEYHARDGHISKSMLADILDCPEIYKFYHEDRNRRPDNDTLNIGNAVHTLALEPQLFESRYHVLAEGVIRNAAHEKYKAELAIAGDRKIVTAKDFVKIRDMAESLTRSPISRALLNRKGVIEHAIYWTEKIIDEETGEEVEIAFKCRPDQLSEDEIVTDIKTDRDVRPHKFKYQSLDYSYDLSVALTCRGFMALKGRMPQNYIFLLVDKEPPHIVAAYDTFRVADDAMESVLEHGQRRLDKAIKLLLKCRRTGIWPGYSDKIEPLSVPTWKT